MSDTLIDPVTSGYLLTQGAPRRDPARGLGNAVFLRLMIPLGSYWADASMGSKLHLLQREKDLSRVATLARQYAEQALAPLLADRRARSLAVTAERPGIGRLHLLVEVVDAAGERLTYTHPIQVI